MGDLWPSLAASTLATEVGTNRSHESMTLNNTRNGEVQDLSTLKLFEDYPAPLLHFASACCVIFMMVGIPGNLITIAALARCKKVRNATAVFIMNLSCSDLLFCCFNLPLGASTFWWRAWPHGHLLCRLFPLLRYGLVAVSLFTVLAITINRYVMIGHPRLYPKLYRRKYLGLMVGSTWACGFGALAATWFESWGRFGLDVHIGSCSILPDDYGRSPKEFLFVVAFVLPCLAIVVCYARIFYIVRKTALQSRGKTNGRKYVPSTPSCQVSNIDHSAISIDNNVQMKHLGKLRKNTFLSPEDSALGSVSNATAGGEKSSSFTMDKSSPTAEKSDVYLDSSIVLKENGITEINSNNNKDNHRRSSELRTNQNLPDPNLLSAPNAVCKSYTEKKLKKFIMEPSSSSGIDTYDDPDNTSIRSNTPTSLESSPNNGVQRKKSRGNRFTSIQSLSRITSVFKSNKSPSGGRGHRRRYNAPLPISSGCPGKMTSKDKKLLKMILVIFISFLVCYLPITITKLFREFMDIRALNIAGYILIYLTTCINPIIYVVMSSEYRQAYKNLLMCRGFGQEVPRKA